MEPILMPTVDQDVRSSEELLVREWRVGQLRALGLSRLLADAFADVIDWDEISNLAESGCSPELALEIVR